MRMLIVMEDHDTGCQQSAPCILNARTQFFSASQCICDVIVVPCCTNSTISTASCSSKQLPSALWLTDICLNFFGLWYRLCGLVVRVLGYRSGGLGSIPGTTRKKNVVGLERGSLSLVSTTEELLDRKVAAPI
jgi:hypothetical protein